MTDLYANWAQLAAAKTLNVDYRLPVRYNRSNMVHIAIHGGAIEPGSSEVASGVAAFCGHNFYSLEAIQASNNSDLHITSTNYDEPIGTALVAKSNYCVSFHGMADQTGGVAESYIGGLDTTLRDAIMASLQGAGFTASVGNNELDGSSAANITNKTRRSMGVQIEMSNTQRAAFFTSGDLSRSNRETGVRTETYFSFVKAIARAVNNVGTGPTETANYRLNEAIPSDAMSDFETFLNFNWEKLRKAVGPPNGTTLPQSGPFDVGDRFYKSDTKSIYILVCKDANWGWHWRPIQDAISPWLTVPTTCLNLGTWTLNPVGGNPFAIALDNRGKCYWRGVIGPSSGTFARNSSQSVFKPLPTGIRPSQRGAYMLGHETLAVGTTATSLQAYQGARIFISDDPTAFATVRGFGGNADFNRVHLTGVNYSVGTAKFTTP